MSTSSNSCPRCGRPLSANAPQGLCPRCLLGSAIAGKNPRHTDAPTTAHSPLPRAFGDYELLVELARGGMGVVYRARQISLNRIVALKLLLGGAWASAEFIQRFLAEAEAAARLDHQGIVPIYEIGVCEGQHFIAMKFIEGETLAAKISRASSRPAPREAAQLLARLARIVHYAHQRGVLHRDLKPGNVIMDPRGEPVLTDFGLAKLVERDLDLTQTRAVLGTPAYVAPETATGNGRNATTSADVYGLGAIFYEVLTGRPPFVGASTVEILRKVAETDPEPPGKVAINSSAIDRDLDTICLKCLEKDPAQRYGSAEALADDLERWSRNEPIVARPSGVWERSGKWARRNPTVAALSLFLLLALLAISIISTVMSVRVSTARQKLALQTEDRRQQIVRLHVATGNRLAEEGDPLTGALWFAEAARLDEQAGRNTDIHRYRLAAAWRSAPELEHLWFHEADATAVAFSPDGTHLVSASRDGTVQLRSVATGATAFPAMTHPAAVELAEFSADGRRIATICADQKARLWEATNSAPIGGEIQIERGERNLAFSPDSRLLAVPVKNGARLFDAATGESVGPLLEHGGHVNFVSFSPDGQCLATASEDHTGVVWNVATGKRAFPMIRHHGALRRMAFSPDGSLLVCADAFLGVHVFEVATGKTTGARLGQQGMAMEFAFSDDGREVLIAGEDNVARLWNVQRGEVRLTLPHRGMVRSARWSPTDEFILTASRDGTARIWRSSTGAPVIAPLREGDDLNAAAFSPDGTRVATAGRNGVVRLWRLPAPDGTLFHVRHSGPVNQVAFSPDGTRLLTTSMDRTARLWNATTGEPVSEPLRHSGQAGFGAFLRDGKIFVTTSGGGIFHVWNAADARPLFELPHPKEFNMAGQCADGTRIYGVTIDSAVQIWNPTNGQLVLRTPRDTAYSGFAELNADGTRLLARAIPRAWNILDATTGAPVAPPVKYGGSSGRARLSPEGHRIALSDTSARPFVRVWDLTTTNWSTPPMLHDKFISGIAWSPDGRTIATIEIEHVVRLWNASTGEELAPPLRHDGRIYEVLFSPDHRRVLTASGDKTARVWDAATGEPITPPLRHATWVVHAAFSPDGNLVATASSDGTARVWETSKASETLDDLLARAQVLSSRALDGTTAVRPLKPSEIRDAWRRIQPRQTP